MVAPTAGAVAASRWCAARDRKGRSTPPDPQGPPSPRRIPRVGDRATSPDAHPPRPHAAAKPRRGCRSGGAYHGTSVAAQRRGAQHDPPALLDDDERAAPGRATQRLEDHRLDQGRLTVAPDARLLDG